MGRFHRILDPGLNILVPVADKIKYVQSLKEIAIDVPKQSAITSDNVTLSIDGVLYLRIIDPYRGLTIIVKENTKFMLIKLFTSFKASYGVEDPEFAITQLAQTTMRSELGKMSLDKVFRERESLNVSIVDSINKASEAWGIACLRYEIRDIRVSTYIIKMCIKIMITSLIDYNIATDQSSRSDANASRSRTKKKSSYLGVGRSS